MLKNILQYISNSCMNINITSGKLISSYLQMNSPSKGFKTSPEHNISIKNMLHRKIYLILFLV